MELTTSGDLQNPIVKFGRFSQILIIAETSLGWYQSKHWGLVHDHFELVACHPSEKKHITKTSSHTANAKGQVACDLVEDYLPNGTSLGLVQPSVKCAASHDQCPCRGAQWWWMTKNRWVMEISWNEKSWRWLEGIWGYNLHGACKLKYLKCSRTWFPSFFARLCSPHCVFSSQAAKKLRAVRRRGAFLKTKAVPKSVLRMRRSAAWLSHFRRFPKSWGTPKF